VTSRTHVAAHHHFGVHRARSWAWLGVHPDRAARMAICQREREPAGMGKMHGTREALLIPWNWSPDRHRDRSESLWQSDGASPRREETPLLCHRCPPAPARCLGARGVPRPPQSASALDTESEARNHTRDSIRMRHSRRIHPIVAPPPPFSEVECLSSGAAADRHSDPSGSRMHGSATAAGSPRPAGKIGPAGERAQPNGGWNEQTPQDRHHRRAIRVTPRHAGSNAISPFGRGTGDISRLHGVEAIYRVVGLPVLCVKNSWVGGSCWCGEYVQLSAELRGSIEFVEALPRKKQQRIGGINHESNLHGGVNP